MPARASGAARPAGALPRLPRLAPSCRAWLDPAAGELLPPVRGELFGRDRFHQLGTTLAVHQPLERRRGRRKPRSRAVLARLADNLRTLDSAQRFLAGWAEAGEGLAPAAQALRDGRALFDSQATAIRAALPPDFPRSLPQLRHPPLAGLARVYGVAWTYVTHTDGSLDADLLAHFLQACQQQHPLTLAELRALPGTLRLVLMEHLARIAARVCAGKAARELANACCDQPDGLDEAVLDAWFEALSARGAQAAFAAQMGSRLADPQAAGALRWQPWLHQRVPDLAEQASAVRSQQAADHASVRHAIESLRALDRPQALRPVVHVSLVRQHLAHCAAYRADSDDTREQCTDAIEALARRCGRSEIEVAEHATALCEAVEPPPAAGPAHFLIGEGRRELEQALGLRRRAWVPDARSLALLYGASAIGGTVLLINAMLQGEALVPWAELLTVLLLAVPASECVLALLQGLAARLVRVPPLPRLALPEGLEAAHRCLVAMPCVLSSADAVLEAADSLEQAYLANREAHTQFALLSDWTDAMQRQAPGDAQLLDTARAAIEALNRRHASGGTPRFLLLHRERRWAKTEGAWVGWERRHGQLAELAAWLAEGGPSPFADLGELGAPAAGIAYLLVADPASVLPPGSLRALVATAAHPLNAPRIDARRRRVEAGIGLLQPRLATGLPRSAASTTAHAWLMSGDGPAAGVHALPPFGASRFQGQGLLNVQAFHAATKGLVPEGRLLDASVLEGLWAGCTRADDIHFTEPPPTHPARQDARRHRRTRAHWQLLSVAGRALQDHAGSAGLWVLLGGLRRSLLAPASAALLWWSFAWSAVPPGRALALVVVAHLASPLLGTRPAHWPRAAARAAWRLVQLLHEALLQADAIVRALWRQAVSRRALLQRASDTPVLQPHRETLLDSLRDPWPVWLAALAWTLGGLLVPGAEGTWLLASGLLWAVSPVLRWAAGQPLSRWLRPPVGEALRDHLLERAQDHWRLLEGSSDAAHHHLCPTRLQLDATLPQARHGGPADTAAYLLAACCAHRLGLIGMDDLVERLERSFAALARLPHHRGHLPAVIDTLALRTPAPEHIDVRQSGLMAACLWAAAQACREAASRPAPHEAVQRALHAAAARVRHATDLELRAWTAERPIRTLVDQDLWAAWRLDPGHLREQLDAALALWQAPGARPRTPGVQPLADLLRQLDSLLRDREVDRDRWGPALRDWAARADACVEAMDFRFLLDPASGELHASWHPDDGTQGAVPFGRMSAAYRLACYVATAKGDRPAVPLPPPAQGDESMPGLDALAGMLLGAPADAMPIRPAGQPEPMPPDAQAGPLAAGHVVALAAFAEWLDDAPVRRWCQQAPLPRSHAMLAGVAARPGRGPAAGTPEAPQEAGDDGRSVDPAAGRTAGWPTQLLGTRRYAVRIAPDGSGTSWWRGHALGRTHDDPLRTAEGHWLMLRHADEVEFHSLTRAPNPRPDAHYRTHLFDGHVRFDAECDEWEASVSVWVAPGDDVELRQVSLHNVADVDAEFELLSWFDAALAPPGRCEAEGELAQLRVRAHAADPRAVVLERRGTEAADTVWAAHFLAACEIEPAAVRITCDRARLLPRLGHAAQARPATAPSIGDGQVDTGLDPVASLAVRLQVPARTRVMLTFATAAAGDSDTLLGLVDQYRQATHLAHARRLSDTVAAIRRREFPVPPSEWHAIQDLVTWLLAAAPPRARPVPPALIDDGALRALGLAPERPIALLRIEALQGLDALRTLLRATRLWEDAGLACQLVVLDGTPAGDPSLRQATAGFDGHAGTGGLWVLPVADASPELLVALQARARVDLLADGRPLSRLVQQALADPRHASRTTAAAALGDDLPPLPDRRERAAIALAPWPEELATSGFSADGSEFELTLTSQRVTPRPWRNVLATPQAGCIVTEAGGGHTWAADAQLTRRSDDELLDPPSEHFLLQDLVTRESWGLLPTMDRNGMQGYRVVHTQGQTRFVHQRGELLVEAAVCMHPHEPAKLVELHLHNGAAQARRLRLVGMVEWILGRRRADRMTLDTRFEPALQAVFAHQCAGEARGGSAFLMLCGLDASQWTCARDEFFDPLGRLRIPRALGGAAGFGLDPCAALDAELTLPPGTELRATWVLGHGADPEAALALARRLREPGAVADAGSEARRVWGRPRQALQVSTPDPMFDALVNHWLPCQAATQVLRADDAEAGSAPRLQQALALAIPMPGLLQRELHSAAHRQVAGIASTADGLWLCIALHRWVELQAPGAPVLDGPAVESLDGPGVYELAAQALEQALVLGVHGLPLIGSGDGLQGMTQVGAGGQGESVWQGWVLCRALHDMAALAAARPDAARVSRWLTARQALFTALAQHGWDGRWYRRAYFDNGHPLGSHLNAECRIEMATQAWSVLASPPDDVRARQALECADTALVDRRHGLLHAFDPPLEHQLDDAGDVQALPPGVRDNGGQCAPAPAWALAAQARLGHAARAWEYFRLLSPAHRTANASAQRRYRLEPYAAALDVCTRPPHAGRANGSWNVQAAAGLYQAAVESILGVMVRGRSLCLQPCLPPHWPQAELRLQLHERPLRVLLQTGGEALPEGARRLRAGEWIALDSLAAETLLVVDLEEAVTGAAHALAEPGGDAAQGL